MVWVEYSVTEKKVYNLTTGSNYNTFVSGTVFNSLLANYLV